MLTTNEQIFCVNCGDKLPPSYRIIYCPKCGYQIKNENSILKYTSDGKPIYQDQEQENISTKITEIQSKGSDDGTSISKGISSPLNASSNFTKQKPMSTAVAIWHIAKFFIFVGLAIMFAYYLYLQLVVWPSEDAYYESHGCYISDGGSQYTCPNGLPPPRN